MPRFNLDNYVDVQARINGFWDDHPDGAIITKLMSPPDDFAQCRYEAQAFRHRDDARPSATGYAFELAGGSGANATSHEENCETSAIGRALANLGYAKTRDDRPSRQEMGKANGAPPARPQPERQQQAAPPRRPGVVDITTGEIVAGTPAPADAPEITDWTAFWAKARPLGYKDRADVEARLKRSIANLTPAQALALIQPKEDAVEADPRKEALRQAHAMMKEKGYNPPHGPLKLLAAFLSPEYPPSLADWTTDQLNELIAHNKDRDKDAIDFDLEDAAAELAAGALGG